MKHLDERKECSPGKIPLALKLELVDSQAVVALIREEVVGAPAAVGDSEGVKRKTLNSSFWAIGSRTDSTVLNIDCISQCADLRPLIFLLAVSEQRYRHPRPWQPRRRVQDVRGHRVEVILARGE